MLCSGTLVAMVTKHGVSLVHPACAFCILMFWRCRGVFGALVAGMVAGLWGVTGWLGFTYYLVSHAVVGPASLP